MNSCNCKTAMLVILYLHLDKTQSIILTNFCCYNSDIVFSFSLSVQGFKDNNNTQWINYIQLAHFGIDHLNIKCLVMFHDS